jgi:2-succinyl-5-enolpyruvyl-6-hydroxy-3-cyclohexene-1-carboxylate synthase
MYSDNKMVLQLLSLMKQYGIRRVVISPGSRHFPLIHSMDRDDYFQLFSVVDERSAAFFALGLIQQTGEPAAVACTSGTSAINYGSAVVEAFYQGLPLVVLTADRLPELLNQKEEQMFRQHDVYEGFIRYQGQLKDVTDPISEWYTNRIINEAFLELGEHSRGPVHLNFPIESHHLDKFQVPALPVVRKIDRIRADSSDEAWATLSARLQGKRVMIVWGQSNPMDQSLRKALDGFVERHDCTILADRLGNCHQPHTIQSAFMSFYAMGEEQRASLAPDVVISLNGNYSFNGEIKNWLGTLGGSFENWDVGRREVMDPFRRLTNVFDCAPAYFFMRMTGLAKGKAGTGYHAGWSKLEATITEPVVPFGEIYSVGALIKSLPKDSVLQIANSLPIRMTHLFPTSPEVEYYCNRGVNGIDGCMSTAVGFAAVSEKPVFLVIGDLTFFYDMNALWNRHLAPNMRILLLNNEGGGVMHVPLDENMAPTLGRHVSAAHTANARGWAESVGFRYIAATSKDTCDAAIATLTDISQPGQILVEAFSRKEVDVKTYKTYLKSFQRQPSLQSRVKRKIRRLIFPSY